MKRVRGLLLLLALALSTVPAADPWLTRAEVAERLQIPVKTLAQWASQRKGPPYRVFGRHTRYKLSECVSWENAQASGGAVA